MLECWVYENQKRLFAGMLDETNLLKQQRGREREIIGTQANP